MLVRLDGSLDFPDEEKQADKDRSVVKSLHVTRWLQRKTYAEVAFTANMRRPSFKKQEKIMSKWPINVLIERIENQ